MTSFDSSRVISAFDGLVEHMQSIELPTLDTFHVSETVLPVFKTLLQQYADQHSRTKKDIASLRSAWTCISSVAPYTPPQAVLESSGSAMVPPALSLPDAAIDAVSDTASGNSELEHSRQLVRRLQQQLQDLTTQYEAQNEDVCTENERLRLQISELEVRLLAAPSNSSASHAVFPKCSDGIVSGKNRRNEQYLRDVFNRHKGAQDGLSGQNLVQSLQDVDAPNIPSSVQDIADVMNQFDANSNGVLEFGEFQQAVNGPDELQMWLGEKQLPIAADAIRPLVGRGSDQLKTFSQLSAADIDHAAAATCAIIPSMLKELHQELQAAFAVQSRIEADMKADPSKFNDFYKMACGTIADFHKGLTGRVGMPHLDFKNAMRQEHCERAGCDVQFTTGNYKITTTPRQEWQYIVGNVPCPDMGHKRCLVPISELLQLDSCKTANLCEEEVIAIVLYTGPMFQIYNTILRRYPAEKFELFEKGNNQFSTTIFVLVSAVQKLSRCTRIPLGTQLYRGLGGKVDLPDIFFQIDDKGCSGYAEWGFLSTTSDRDVALGYSGVKERRPKAMVMEIETSSIDRGADISEFSQYPGEKEFLYLPCSFVQRVRQGSGRVQVVDGGLVTCFSVKVNLNIKTQNVEELQEQKKTMHMVSARAMIEEVRYELFEWVECADAKARFQLDPSRSKASLRDLALATVEQCINVVKRHETVPLEQYVNDSTFRALSSEILDTKLWAKEKKELWMHDLSQYLVFVRTFSLRACHRLRQSFLRQRLEHFRSLDVFESSAVVSTSLEFLGSRGLLKGGSLEEVNADGEDMLVEAGGDGWTGSDIHAAAFAGANLGASDRNGCNGVWNASRYGHKHSIVALLELKSDVNMSDGNGMSPISASASSGHADCLKMLLDAGGDVNKCNNDGWSPIYVASFQGYTDCLKLLLAAGGDVNKCDNAGWSPIYVASFQGHTDCLKLLLPAGRRNFVSRLLLSGGDVNKCSNDGVSPIYAAADKGRAECLKLLLAAGGDVNKCDNDGRSPISASGNAECFKLLLDAGGDVNKCDNKGASPIYNAALLGRAERLKLLLAAGGDVNKCNNDGRSPIWVAAYVGRAECLKLLLDAGGDVNKCPLKVQISSAILSRIKSSFPDAGSDVNEEDNDAESDSPIFIAAKEGHADCLILLLHAGGDVNKCNEYGDSPIHVAADKGRAECLKLLLAAGGDVNKCDKHGFSPIYAAAEKGRAECLKLLLDAGGDVNKCNKHGRSPIYIAAEEGHADCLKLLLDAGGDVNKCNNDGRSPIYIAAQNGHADCLKLLLDAGADPRSSFKGTSALDIARQKQHAECTRLLEAALT
jgi:ankyrin repeat protein